MYSTGPDGLSGNEDVGQMSAWYVLSSMGLYEVEPGSGPDIMRGAHLEFMMSADKTNK